MADVALLRRRHRPSDGYRGCECWLIGVYPIGSAVPILTITNRPKHLGGDISYGGKTYTYYNCAIQNPPDTDSEHALPEADLRISNILRALVPSLYANDFYRGFTVKILPFNDAEPGSDYADDLSELTWVNYEMDGEDLVVTLAVPQELVDIVPEDTYSAYSCRHRFRQSAGVYGARCGYTAKDILTIEVPAGPGYGRLALTTDGDHGFISGDVIELSAVTGITGPDLNDVWTVDYFNDTVVKVNGTDGADYSPAGVISTGGLAGHFSCPKHRLACLARNRLASFGGVSGQRSDVLRVAI